MKKSKILGLIAAAAVAVSALAVPASAEETTYHAYLGLQTPNWTYRDAWNSANGLGSDYFGSFIYGNETQEAYGTVTDADITSDGTYTVSANDFGSIISSDFSTANQDYFNLLFISTDIPLDAGVSITDVTLKLDGKTVKTYETGLQDPDDKDYVHILIQNIWNNDYDGIKDIGYYAAPTSSVEMTFTITGLDNASAAAADTSSETPASDSTTTSSTTGNTAPAAVASVMAVAGVAAIASKKRK